MIKYQYHSPLGTMTMLASDKALHGLWFNGQKHFGAGFTLDEIATAQNSITKHTAAWLDRYFAKQAPDPREIPLALETTPYRQRILNTLLTIPIGSTITYQELAQQAAPHQKIAPGAARAVGGAVAHNPILILIPCHRVIGSDGQLTGYAGGTERKLALLRLEGIDF
ncbi:methylated-DNA--[protein]-cysteine S-methyltransferase [Limosilactobacillus mucosae]|uniref:methylated-DNA--[protein]-cysteine S-methyltransferase n=1 Tax=Limosilactobacillus mucosae TaxID=97478 RepID=UPI0025A3F7B7|nr:methylated-DNA--[protein]-cysteine S-methyltransferase [Limosilactobacillus mucosae]MDM8220678.1 methylated-DNA--[protein]-cysteine S-methyltransferase [Limosilactobacillus mucosae]MDM8315310.1 methylated-DNA--[protein]-cysteine S-methyltransferase [Limosilactobacillus mucosae]